ncbi:hypothetical protein [Thermomonospora umbrina]|uniref:Uncharacterized protein n=1 Tax=Thermomonospora umbrina TaxID=111806 RepID=A0A3D9SV81_9ACTN|nr:hypothetical protein [Thermomonospora umbrina]REE98410.1 hypothetical protein DFJ69_3899 [Thermomonospora umbrina]
MRPDPIDVQAWWRERRVPDGEFVVYGDGGLVVMDLSFDGGGVPRWRPVLRASRWEPVEWLDVDAVLARDAHEGHRVLAGEASHGSIGWVALTRGDDTLEWAAISQWSNPFAHVALDAVTVTAISTSGHVWAFPRGAPQHVIVREAGVVG